MVEGGELYQLKRNGDVQMLSNTESLPRQTKVYPGGLTITRSLGDAQSKLKELGGNPFLIINEPQIFAFELRETHDFLVIASNGVFESLTNKDVSACAWKVLNHEGPDISSNVHKLAGLCTESILKNSMLRNSQGNVSAIIIVLPGILNR